MNMLCRSRLVEALRDASWLTADRARAYCRVLAATTLVFALIWIGLSHGGLDTIGKPLGTDFLSFWTAAKLAVAGTPRLAYDVSVHAAAETAAFNGFDTGYYAFFYPPIFLLVCFPLGLMPWGVALPAWLGVTGFAYWRVISSFFDRGRSMILPILAYPAVLTTISHGQNAFLSTDLFGGAILALKKRPILAGLLFGSLAIKPHLAVLVPIFLMASGAWTALLAAICTVLALGIVSILVFGPGIWLSFFAAAPLARAALEQNLVGAEKMQSVFAAVQLWHGPLPLAYASQIVVVLAAATILIHLVRARPGSDAAGPALVAASLIASPFLLDYDLTLLAIPLAWVFARALSTHFLPWEKTVLLAGFMLPLISRSIAMHAGVRLGPIVVAALLLVVVRRGLTELHAPAALEPVAVTAG